MPTMMGDGFATAAGRLPTAMPAELHFDAGAEAA